MPNQLTKFGKKGLILTARANLDEGMEEAADRRDAFKKRTQRTVGSGPSVLIDRFWRIGGVKRNLQIEKEG